MYSNTALSVASHWGHRGLAEVLCAFDADIDLDNDNNPLMQAVEACNLECILLLLALNADTTKRRKRDRWSIAQTDVAELRQLLADHAKKSDKERRELRLQTLQQIKSTVGVRLMRYAQPKIVGICLALSSFDVPPYVLLWIIDWLPNYDRVSHHKKIHLIESVHASIGKIKERRATRQRFGLRPRKK